ncbi:hypothetical protein D3C85_1462650 [compost metagenome]
MAALLEIREQRVDLVDAQAARAQHRRQQQVFLRAEAGENAAFLGAIGHAQARNGLGQHLHGLLAIDLYAALAFLQQADDGAQRGGLARAIAAQQAHDFTLAHFEVHAVQRQVLAIVADQALDRQAQR